MIRPTILTFSSRFAGWLTVVSFLLGGGAAPGLAERPHIVLVNLDDADGALLSDEMLEAYYPHLRKLAAGGLRFTNMHATTPFCAPSRAALMTGQYAFHNGVKVNQPGHAGSHGFGGGYETFLARGHEGRELGSWLKGAGYRTMHVGKYHHAGFDFRVPLGWDDFTATLGARYYGTYRFTNRLDPAGESVVNGEDEYITESDALEAAALIRRHAVARPEQPFFLYIAPLAPHYPQEKDLDKMVDQSRFGDFAADARLPRDPDWNEADVRDKPDHLQLPLLTPAEESLVEAEYLSRLRAIKSVDRLVGRIWSVLEDHQLAENTVFLVTSDNGYQLGHHRLTFKLDPFDRTTRVPLLVRGPGIPAGGVADHLLAHLDLCPTILELAGAPLPPELDGRSFVPLLHDPDGHDPATWQRAILIENWSEKTMLNGRYPAAYTALRMPHSIFVQWANGAREYYDLADDPWQLENAYDSLPLPFREQLQADLRSFRPHDSEPLATMVEPAGGPVVRNRVEVEGYAEDNDSVQSVGIVLQSYRTGQFFDGAAWQSAWARFAVPPVDRESPLTRWELVGSIAPPEGMADDLFLVTARPFDDTGRYPNEIPWTLVAIDIEPPRAGFGGGSHPTVSFQEDSVRLSGTVTENWELKQVRVVVRNGSGAYWDGDAWQGSWAYTDAQLVADGTWFVEFARQVGTYTASVRAFDTAGNFQGAPDVLRFEVEGSPE